MLEFIN